MIRAFVALTPPSHIREALSDLQDPALDVRWVDEDRFHVTLAFLGETPGPDLDILHDALCAVASAPFDLTLAGVGAFGGEKPHSLHARVAPSEPLRILQGRVAAAAGRAGLSLESRKFRPHVTLAYLRGGDDRAGALAWVHGAANLFHADPFTVDSFALFRSDPGKGGSVYTELARYPF